MSGFDTALQVLGIIWASVILCTGPLNAALARRPALSTKQASTRRDAYLSVVKGLTFLASITLIVDVLSGQIGLRTFSLTPGLSLVPWTLLTLLVCVGISSTFLFIRKISGTPFPPSVRRLMPQTRGQLTAGIGLSILAGLTEEYIFRGFCLLVLVSITGNQLMPFILVTFSFGIGHGYQDLIGLVRAGLAGAVLAVPVLVLGSLLPAIIAHAGIDVFSFALGYSSRLENWGLVPKPER